MLCIFLAACPCLEAQVKSTSPLRVWTNNQGKQIHASFSNLKDHKVGLTLANGQTVYVDLQQLSEADQNFAKSQSFSAAGASSQSWPGTVEVSTRSLETKVTKEDPANQNYVYRSEFFEFHSQDKLALSVVKDIARSFELTRSLITSLPWSIAPKPPEDLGFYQAKFYLSRRNYALDGGPANSAGVYSTSDRIFKVPFETLGLRMRGKTWFKDENFENGTVIHELTHQMMHSVLPLLTPWLIEGTAEYAEMLPRGGTKIYAAAYDKGIRDYMKRMQMQNLNFSQCMKPSQLMQLTMNQWSIQSDITLEDQAIRYMSSCLLIYYFNHLDESQGANFRAFMKQIHEVDLAWQSFFKNPKVKHMGNGRYQYPSDLPLPKNERSEKTALSLYSVLLGEKSLEQLDSDFENAFKKFPFRN